MQHSGAPSVEEILEAIKQVIARDNRRTAADSVKADVGADGDDDVLDLACLAGLQAEEGEGEDGAKNGDSLLAAATRNSMRESLAALAMISEPRAQPQIVRSGETSLEGMARELLRPALAEWLDKHLPPLVEQMVAAEISRIVGKRG
jgi:cell pole-organizing protein PopZ